LIANSFNEKKPVLWASHVGTWADDRSGDRDSTESSIKSLDCIVKNVCLRFVTHACQHLDPHHLNENTRSAAFRRSAPLGWKCLHIIKFPIYQYRDLALIPLLKIAIHLFSTAFRFPPRFANCLFRGLSIQFTHFSSRWKSLFQHSLPRSSRILACL